MDVLEKLCFIILPLLVTALLYSVVTRKQKEREKIIEASGVFRSAFDVAVHALESIQFCDLNILNENFRVHEKAMIIFRDNLKGRKLKSFNTDWKQYEQYCQKRVVDAPLLSFIAKEVSDINGQDDSAEIDLKHRQEALKHINNILSYANK